jgi:hypothetical protein
LKPKQRLWSWASSPKTDALRLGQILSDLALNAALPVVINIRTG